MARNQLKKPWLRTPEVTEQFPYSRAWIYSQADFAGGTLKTQLLTREGKDSGIRLWNRRSLNELLGPVCKLCGELNDSKSEGEKGADICPFCEELLRRDREELEDKTLTCGFCKETIPEGEDNGVTCDQDPMCETCITDKARKGEL